MNIAKDEKPIQWIPEYQPTRQPTVKPSPTPSAGVEAMLANVDGLLKARDYAGAERALTAQLSAHPDDWQAWQIRAITKRLEKDARGALADSEKAISLNPRDGASRNVRARSLLDLGRSLEAVDEAGKALALDPRDARALTTRAAAWRALGRSAERLADLKLAAEIDPSLAAAYQRAVEDADDPQDQPLARRAGADYGTWALYGAGGAGLLLVLGGALLLFTKTGQTITHSKAAMRLMDRVAAAAQPPKLEGFEVTRKVGEGGMGIVYEALDRTLKRKVALKQMRPHIAADPRQRRRFLREASTVASLRHPNIVEIHSAFEEDGHLFLVFEFVSGESLHRLIETRGALPSGEALALLRPMARALDYAHAKGVIHQDLKPANIMLGEGGAKVMDFGIARRLGAPQTVSTTTANEIVGTPPYMAPEQESGAPVKASDLYALGVCAYELLGGRRPFERASLMQKLEANFQPLSGLQPRLPKNVDAVLAKALAPRPEERFATAQELLGSLEEALS